LANSIKSFHDPLPIESSRFESRDRDWCRKRCGRQAAACAAVSCAMPLRGAARLRVWWCRQRGNSYTQAVGSGSGVIEGGGSPEFEKSLKWDGDSGCSLNMLEGFGGWEARAVRTIAMLFWRLG
jgi:hypothetical protein